MKKRNVCLALCLILVLAFCGCGNQSSIETAEGADERVADAYVDAMEYFAEKDSYYGFWEVSAGYACYGDEIYGSELDLSDESDKQRGAIMLAHIMNGENPYNMDGKDLVADLQAQGTEGAFAIPVLNFLGLQAAGAEMDAATEKAFVEYCCEQLRTLSAGPDIGGWAAVALSRYADNPAYSDLIDDAVAGYVDVVSKNLASGTMGSDGITYGCVVMGLTALTDGGMDGMDPTTDSPWIDMDPLAVMYENLINGEENVSDYYKSQYYLEFTDLYRVLYEDQDMAWIRCGVNADRLAALIAEAEAFVGDPAVDAALEAAKALSEEELAEKVPSWGKIYYDLFDAVKAAK
ncbi:MAG: hypothetical protein IKV45_02645 [Firmicutes bacterium]|nr:hypothetical protein [Bacillota bacterium]